MKNLIALLICIMSLTIFAEAGDYIRFDTYDNDQLYELNFFTFIYSAEKDSEMKVQIFDENWNPVSSFYGHVREAITGFEHVKIRLEPSNSSKHYVQVKLFKNGIRVGWDQRVYYGKSKKNSALSNAVEAGIQLEAYPNPVKDLVNLAYNLVKEGEVDVEVYNPMGKLVKVIQNNETQIAGRHTNTIDVSALNSGMYLLKVATEEGIETSRILKQ